MLTRNVFPGSQNILRGEPSRIVEFVFLFWKNTIGLGEIFLMQAFDGPGICYGAIIALKPAQNDYLQAVFRFQRCLYRKALPN